MNTKMNTPTTLSLDDTDASQDTSVSYSDTSLNISFTTSRASNHKPRVLKDGVKRKAVTYRGVDSKSYNSNVRIGRKQNFVSTNTRYRQKNTLQNEETTASNLDQKHYVVDGRKSAQSYQSSASGNPTEKKHWQRIVCGYTSHNEQTEEVIAESNRSDFKALNECVKCARDKIRLKMLPCLHSYCIECLQKQGESTEHLSSMKCLLCKTKVDLANNDIKDLDDNIYTQFSEMSISENERCHTCSETVPKCRCSECNLNFCTNCVKDHLDNIKDKPHYIVNIKPEMVGRTSLETECKEHKPFTLNLYCVNCSKLICGRCAIEKHNNHVAEDVEMTANDMRNNLRDILSSGSATRITKEMADQMHRLREQRTKLEHDTDTAVNAVQLHIKQLKDEIEDFERSTIQMIRNKGSSLLSTLDSKAKDAETALKSTHLSIETMRRIIDRARDLELIEKFPNLKSLASELRKTARPSPTQCIDMTYLPLVGTLKSAIGRVNFESSLSKPIELREMSSMQVFKHITSIYPVDLSKAWVSFRKYIQLCYKDGSFGSRIDFGEPVMSIACDSNKIIFVACKTAVKVIGSKRSPKLLFQLPHEPSDMKITETDEIIISFRDAKRVAVFSYNGKLMKDLDLRHLGYLLGSRISEPWKIGINERHEVFITDFSSEAIAVFDKQFEIKTVVTSNVFRHCCITCFKGILFLSDYKQDCVKVYSEDGQLLQTCRTPGLHAPCSLAVDHVGDIWIGSWMGMVKVYKQR